MPTTGAGIFARRTNQTQEARVYSRDGPIGRCPTDTWRTARSPPGAYCHLLLPPPGTHPRVRASSRVSGAGACGTGAVVHASASPASQLAHRENLPILPASDWSFIGLCFPAGRDPRAFEHTKVVRVGGIHQSGAVSPPGSQSSQEGRGYIPGEGTSHKRRRGIYLGRWSGASARRGGLWPTPPLPVHSAHNMFRGSIGGAEG
eukprot:1192222-Prorocentrum_minimum.AAC.2